MRHLTIDELELNRKSALEHSDAPAYAYFCNELGIPPEDDLLFERGNGMPYTIPSSLIRLKPKFEYFPDKDIVSPIAVINTPRTDNELYVPLAITALKLFPAGWITKREYIKRGAEINRAGKPVNFKLDRYRQIPKEKLFEYFTKTVTEQVADFVKDHCPKTLEEIIRRNKEELRNRKEVR